jgi:AcrR family transcriptional regulator
LFTLSTLFGIFLLEVKMERNKYHHKDLKKRIIREGTSLLARVGYGGFSLRQVAKNLGVSHAAPYRHFRNKEDLIIHIIKEVQDSFYESLNSSVLKYPDNPLEQLRDMGIQYILFSINNADLVKIIFFNARNKDIASRVRSKDSFKLLLDVVKRCKAKGLINASDTMLASLLIWGEVHGISSLLIEGNIAHEGKLEDFVVVLVDGIMELIINENPPS